MILWVWMCVCNGSVGSYGWWWWWCREVVYVRSMFGVILGLYDIKVG